MTTERCGTCRYSAPCPSVHPSALQCRRHAPQGNADPAGPLLFPVVTSADWCGDYEPKENP